MYTLYSMIHRPSFRNEHKGGWNHPKNFNRGANLLCFVLQVWKGKIRSRGVSAQEWTPDTYMYMYMYCSSKYIVEFE